MTDQTREYLSFAVTLADEAPADDGGTEGARQVTGIAVPYDEPMSRPDWRTGAMLQVFAPGSAIVRDNATFYYGHDHLNGGLPVGRISEWEHTPEGLRITATISATPKGDEVYTLLKDGVLNRFSIGYYPVASAISEDGLTLTHTEIDVFETSTVPDPQYPTAVVETVLSKKEGTMPEQSAPATSEDIVTLSTSIADLERRLATLGTADDGDAAPAAPYGSRGAFLQAVARREDDALAYLAFVAERVAQYQAGVIADLGDWVKDSWVGELTQRPRARKLHALFESGALPATGMSVEYGFLDTAASTANVAEQATENTDLAYGKIAFDTATAPVKTYGGWGDMSFQTIQRSGVAVIEKFFAFLDGKYDQTTEAALRAIVLNPANATELTGTGVDTLTTVAGITDFICDASFALEDNINGPLVPEFVLVSRDLFKSWANLTVTAGDRPFLDRDAGKIDVVGLSGEVLSLPVIPVNAGATTGFARVGHSSAIKTFEDGGAPFRLQDSDITNLSEAASIYGYEAIAVQDKTALIAPDDDA